MTIGVVIIFMATLALVEGVPLNCLEKQPRNIQFRCKHVFQDGDAIPDKNDLDGWGTYLRKYNLCYDYTRTTQSFMKNKDFKEQLFCQKNTCQNRLCTSMSKVNLYNVKVNYDGKYCKVDGVEEDKFFVVVGCEKFEYWLPIHFERYYLAKPDYHERLP